METETKQNNDDSNFSMYSSILSFIFKWNNLTAGWTSIMVVVTFFAGVQLSSLWIMSEYIARIYDETKQRLPTVTKKP